MGSFPETYKDSGFQVDPPISCGMTLIKTLFLHDVSGRSYLLYRVPVFRSSVTVTVLPPLSLFFVVVFVCFFCFITFM